MIINFNNLYRYGFTAINILHTDGAQANALQRNSRNAYLAIHSQLLTKRNQPLNQSKLSFNVHVNFNSIAEVLMRCFKVGKNYPSIE